MRPVAQPDSSAISAPRPHLLHVAAGARCLLLIPAFNEGASVRKLVLRLRRALPTCDVLVIDDWAMTPMTESERRDCLEICDRRYQVRSTLLTSQLPVNKWHAQIGDPTVADSILDRLVHNAHRLDLAGDSMRKKRGGRSGKEE